MFLSTDTYSSIYCRSRLASASVPLHKSNFYSEFCGKASRKDVIPLLCSIFLANQGAGEAVHEGKVMPWVSNVSPLSSFLVTTLYYFYSEPMQRMKRQKIEFFFILAVETLFKNLAYLAHLKIYLMSLH